MALLVNFSTVSNYDKFITTSGFSGPFVGIIGIYWESFACVEFFVSVSFFNEYTAKVPVIKPPIKPVDKLKNFPQDLSLTNFML